MFFFFFYTEVPKIKVQKITSGDITSKAPFLDACNNK